VTTLEIIDQIHELILEDRQISAHIVEKLQLFDPKTVDRFPTHAKDFLSSSPKSTPVLYTTMSHIQQAPRNYSAGGEG
jgi:hypothetical protein